MKASQRNVDSSGLRGQPFQTTDWSVIGQLDTPDFAEALALLCQQYWYPVYAFIRRHARDTHHAEDLTQAFFSSAISKQTFRMAAPDRGRFRSFLLTSVKNFLSNERAAQATQRRGGGQTTLSLDFAVAVDVYARNQSSETTPDHEFDRAWTLAILEQSIERLRDEHASNSQKQRFELFAPSLKSEPLDYESIAQTLNISVVTARKSASRFRARYGQLLREAVAGTLTDGENLEEEIAWMIRVVGKA